MCYTPNILTSTIHIADFPLGGDLIQQNHREIFHFSEDFLQMETVCCNAREQYCAHNWVIKDASTVADSQDTLEDVHYQRHEKYIDLQLNWMSQCNVCKRQVCTICYIHNVH